MSHALHSRWRRRVSGEPAPTPATVVRPGSSGIGLGVSPVPDACIGMHVKQYMTLFCLLLLWRVLHIFSFRFLGADAGQSQRRGPSRSSIHVHACCCYGAHAGDAACDTFARPRAVWIVHATCAGVARSAPLRAASAKLLPKGTGVKPIPPQRWKHAPLGARLGA